MIAIIGAGISGLSLGCFLKSQGFAEQEIFIFESTKRCGGVLQTISEQGYKIEASANLYPYTHSSAQELCKLLGLANFIIPLQAEKKYLYLNQELREFSINPFYLLTTSLISWKSKYQLLQNFWKKPQVKLPQNLKDFFQKQFGAEIFQKAAEPLLGGIFAGQPDKLSLEACFPGLGALIEKNIPLAWSAFKRKKISFVGFDKGMGQLVSAMQEYLKNRIFYAKKLTNISFQNKKIYCHFSQQKEVFDKVILTIPAYQAAKVLREHLIVKDLQKITYAPVMICALGFEKKDTHFPLQALGFLNPNFQFKELLGGFFVSNMFSNRTPSEKYSLLQLILGGAGCPEVLAWSDKEVLENLKKYCNQVFQIKENFCYNKIIRWKKAIPQYSMNQLNILEKIKLLQKKHSLYFHSNSYQGIGLADRIEYSFHLAQSIIYGD